MSKTTLDSSQKHLSQKKEEEEEEKKWRR